MKRLKTGTEYLNYGRDIIAGWGSEVLTEVKQPRILDIGAGGGSDLASIADRLGSSPDLHGVDCHIPNLETLQARNIRAVSLDIERDTLPYSDGFFHLAVANQVLEHVKEVFWILSEMARVVRPGGHVIIGVPNLASLHNRVGLFLGFQPTSINLVSAHVRGFTRRNAEELFTLGGFFQATDFKGSNFYPMPPALAIPLSRMLPSLAVSNFYLLRRTERTGRYIDILETMYLETPFYRGKHSTDTVEP